MIVASVESGSGIEKPASVSTRPVVGRLELLKRLFLGCGRLQNWVRHVEAASDENFLVATKTLLIFHKIHYHIFYLVTHLLRRSIVIAVTFVS